MADFKIQLEDPDGLLNALAVATHFDSRLDKVVNKNLTDMFNRSKRIGSKGGTPVDTGELRNSVSVVPTRGVLGGEIGYSKEYAPYVEYGHRTIGGGYVEGQHFLSDNLAEQTPQLLDDVRAALDEVFKR